MLLSCVTEDIECLELTSYDISFTVCMNRYFGSANHCQSGGLFHVHKHKPRVQQPSGASLVYLYYHYEFRALPTFQ